MITFMRHAQSLWNTRQVKKNDDDIDLSTKGMKDARKIKGYFDLIICSNTTRTRKTLLYSSIEYKHVLISEYCKEIKSLGRDKSIYLFKKQLKKLSMAYPKILVISHRGYIKKLTGKNLSNLEQYTCSFENINS